MRDQGQGRDRSVGTGVARKPDPDAARVPGRRSLVQTELEDRHAGAPPMGPGKRTLVELLGWGAGGPSAEAGSFEGAVAEAHRRLGELEAALAAGDRRRAREAAAALEQAMAAAREHAAAGPAKTQSHRMGVMVELIAHAEPMLARARGGDAPADVAARGMQGAGGALPHMDRIQQSFGRHDVRGLPAHVGGAAAASASALGAQAYAHDGAVAFAGPPDLRTAAHEAAHVVQQRHGLALKGGLDGGASDPFERHADAVADAVVAGRSAEGLLDATPGGGAVGGAVQRKSGADSGSTDTSQLPDGKNFEVLADGSVLVRISWLLSDPGMRKVGSGLSAPACMAEVLAKMRASGTLAWMDPARIPEFSQKLEFNRALDEKQPFGRFGIAFGVYALVGPPPSVDVLVTRDGDGLAIVLRQSVAAPGGVDRAKEIALSAAVRDRIVGALEHFTKLSADPSIKNTIINGHVHWAVDVDPSMKGILVPFTKHAMEQLFGAKQWRRYLKHPPKNEASGALTGHTAGEKPPPRWLPKGSLVVTPKLPQYVTGSSVQVELAWDFSVHPHAGFVLLPHHCDYEWTVRHNGKVVDHDGVAILTDNRTTSLELDGGPGTYEISVVATSDHFLTHDHEFKAKVHLRAIDEATFDKQTFDKVAAGKDGPFKRDAAGNLHLKPKQHALTTEQDLQGLAMTEGAIDALEQRGKLTATDHDVLHEELEKQRAALEAIAKKTAGGTPYIVRGTFVSREDSTSTQLKLLMHMMHRGTTGGQGEYAVLLHDTTLGDVTQHPGSAEGPVARDVDSAYRNLELDALEDMADHFHAHNDYPSGTVHLAAQQLTSGKVWETTRDTDNGRKTAKKILGGVAMVGGVALLFIPGGGFVSAAVFTVTATAGVASVGLEIEDRYEKEGELRFDRRLALDVLQVVSVALPFGTMTRVLAEASTVAKTGYLLSMTGVDAAQGFLIATEVRDQLRLIDANAALQLANASSDEQRKQILMDRDRKVAQVIGGAMVNGSFILVSVGSGIKNVVATMRTGISVSLREPVAALPGKGISSMEETLKRGWFEHQAEGGSPEKVVLTKQERTYLEQELAAAKVAADPASGATQMVPRDQVADTLRHHEAEGAKVHDLGRDPSNGKRRYEVAYPDGRKTRITEGEPSDRPGVEAAPTVEEAAAARAAADRAEKIQAQRDAELTTLIEGSKKPVILDTAIIGAGQTGTQAFASLSDVAGAPPGARITAIPDVINIAPEGSMYRHHGDFRIGQKPGEHRGPAHARHPGEFTADHGTPTRASDYARALTMTGYDAGMVTFKAAVTEVQVRPAAGWGDGVPPEAADMPIRIVADGKTIYAKRVISAGGLGKPNPISGRVPGFAAHEPALAAAGRLVYAQDALTLPGDGHIVVVVGDGASGAWACEAAIASGAKKVYWVGAPPRPGTEVDPKVRADLEAMHLTNEQIATFARGYNDRNAPTFRYIESGQIELHVGFKDAEIDPATGRVKTSLADREDPVLVDGIVAATGQQLDLPKGMDKEHMRFKMVKVKYHGEERLVALDAIDPARPDVPLGIRVEGAQMARMGPLVVKSERAEFEKLLGDQAGAASVPADSKGVVGSIYQTNVDVPLANQEAPLARGGQ